MHESILPLNIVGQGILVVVDFLLELLLDPLVLGNMQNATRDDGSHNIQVRKD